MFESSPDYPWMGIGRRGRSFGASGTRRRIRAPSSRATKTPNARHMDGRRGSICSTPHSSLSSMFSFTLLYVPAVFPLFIYVVYFSLIKTFLFFSFVYFYLLSRPPGGDRWEVCPERERDRMRGIHKEIQKDRKRNKEEGRERNTSGIYAEYPQTSPAIISSVDS